MKQSIKKDKLHPGKNDPLGGESGLIMKKKRSSTRRFTSNWGGVIFVFSFQMSGKKSQIVKKRCYDYFSKTEKKPVVKGEERGGILSIFVGSPAPKGKDWGMGNV